MQVYPLLCDRNDVGREQWPEDSYGSILKSPIAWKPVVMTFGQKRAYYDEDTPIQSQLIC